MRTFLLPLLLLSAVFVMRFSSAQEIDSQRIQYNIPYLLNGNEYKIHEKQSDIHTSIRPYRTEYLVEYIDPREVKEYYNGLPSTSRFQDLLFHRDLLKYSGEQNGHFFDIRANPLMDFSVVSDSELGETLLTNTRGAQIYGQLGSKVTFYTDLYETQTQLPGYIHAWAQSNRFVVPAQGRPNFTDGNNYDFSNASGYVRYNTGSFFDIELGTGRNFFGDGYRSMLLGNITNNYPYLKINTRIGKRVHYTNLYTQMLDINPNPGDQLHFKKYTSMHYLSLALGERWNIGLFEAVVWNGETDNAGNQQRGYELAYLNPILFYRTVEHMLGSGGGNALLGLNLKYKFSDATHLYGQFLLDEFKISEFTGGRNWWGNKYALQLGVRSFNLFGVPRLNLRGEMNYARPFTYSHRNSLSNYGHFQQSLAHPLGSNFIEFIAIADYQLSRWLFRGQVIFATKGYNSTSIVGGTTQVNNFGGDIFLPDNTRAIGDFGYTNFIGERASQVYFDGSVAFLINPSYDLKIEAGATFRSLTPENTTLSTQKTMLLRLGLTARLFNKYYDF